MCAVSTVKYGRGMVAGVLRDDPPPDGLKHPAAESLRPNRPGLHVRPIGSRAPPNTPAEFVRKPHDVPNLERLEELDAAFVEPFDDVGFLPRRFPVNRGVWQSHAGQPDWRDRCGLYVP